MKTQQTNVNELNQTSDNASRATSSLTFGGITFFNFDKTVEKKYDLVFTGNMNYAPNIECSEFIVNEILPLLQKIKPSVQLLISGANPNKRILNLDLNAVVAGTIYRGEFESRLCSLRLRSAQRCVRASASF